MNPRYKILEESYSGHCCFDFTVVDNTIFTPGSFCFPVCETFTKETAKLVCDSLNARNELLQYINGLPEPTAEQIINKIKELYT